MKRPNHICFASVPIRAYAERRNNDYEFKLDGAAVAAEKGSGTQGGAACKSVAEVDMPEWQELAHDRLRCGLGRYARGDMPKSTEGRASWIPDAQKEGEGARVFV
jgi:hypothetical protein